MMKIISLLVTIATSTPVNPNYATILVNPPSGSSHSLAIRDSVSSRFKTYGKEQPFVSIDGFVACILMMKLLVADHSH